jgi:cytochrome P450
LRALVRKLPGKRDNRLNDDIVSRMVRTTYPGAVDFDIKRLGINAGGLLISAIETTSQAVAQVIEYLLEDPEWLAKARSAAQEDNPAEFDGIVWEALRFVPISSSCFARLPATTPLRKAQTTRPRSRLELMFWP